MDGHVTVPGKVAFLPGEVAVADLMLRVLALHGDEPAVDVEAARAVVEVVVEQAAADFTAVDRLIEGDVEALAVLQEQRVFQSLNVFRSDAALHEVAAANLLAGLDIENGEFAVRLQDAGNV